MALSQPYKDLIDDGVFASSDAAERLTPAEAGLDRAEGWPLAYEQIGSGKFPEREVFNNHHYEITSGLIDIAKFGVLQWDAAVNYPVTADAKPFVSTASGLWVSDVSTGPAFGNATDPDTLNQQTWRRY